MPLRSPVRAVRAEAQTLLQRQLAVMPVSERNVTDQLRLVLGLVSGEGSLASQQAFLQLLRDGQKPETQRLALQLLTHAAQNSRRSRTVAA